MTTLVNTDPDRGESNQLAPRSIAAAQLKDTEVTRVVFNAITKSAVTEAMKIRAIWTLLVHAYLARRALIIWWLICPLCCGANYPARVLRAACNRLSAFDRGT